MVKAIFHMPEQVLGRHTCSSAAHVQTAEPNVRTARVPNVQMANGRCRTCSCHQTQINTGIPPKCQAKRGPCRQTHCQTGLATRFRCVETWQLSVRQGTVTHAAPGVASGTVQTVSLCGNAALLLATLRTTIAASELRTFSLATAVRGRSKQSLSLSRSQVACFLLPQRNAQGLPCHVG